MIKIEWIEVPGGKFTMGLSTEQWAQFKQRLYQAYGVDQLPQDDQALFETVTSKPLSDFVPAERMFWDRTDYHGDLYHLSECREALLVLKNISEARTVHVPTFYIARYPITHAQAEDWYASSLAQEAGWAKNKYRRPKDVPRDRPCHIFHWDEADALAHWLGGRLPTVAEWEKAARGTDGRLYPWGNEWNPAAGNFNTPESRSGNSEKRRGIVTAVGAYPEGASPFGVMDMAGNLSEYTATIDPRCNRPIFMGYSIKIMPSKAQFFWAWPMQRDGTFEWMWYMGCRPVMTQWGRQSWPGY